MVSLNHSSRLRVLAAKEMRDGEGSRPDGQDDKLYEDLRRDGASKEKAARIANAKAAGTLDHESTHLENRTKDELYDEAKEIGIEGRSDMSKDELVTAIRKG